MPIVRDVVLNRTAAARGYNSTLERQPRPIDPYLISWGGLADIEDLAGPLKFARGVTKAARGGAKFAKKGASKFGRGAISAPKSAFKGLRKIAKRFGLGDIDDDGMGDLAGPVEDIIQSGRELKQAMTITTAASVAAAAAGVLLLLRTGARR